MDNSSKRHSLTPIASQPAWVYCGILVVLILFSFTGCGEKPSPPLRIGTNVWPGYEPLYLARDLAYLNPKTVHLVEYPSSSEVIRAFRNHAIDGAALTLDEVFLLAEDGFEPKVVLIMDISNGGDVIVGRPELATVMDLKGRRIAVESTALGAYVLSRALVMSGLKVGDVQVIHLEGSEHAPAFKSGTVDAVVTFEPVRSELLAAGASLLFDSTQIPGEIVDVLMIRKSYLDENLKKVNELLTGWFRAVGYLNKNPRDAAVKMALREQIDADRFLKSLDGLQIPTLQENLKYLDGVRPELATLGRELAHVMLKQRLLKDDIDVNALIDSKPINTVAQ